MQCISFIATHVHVVIVYINDIHVSTAGEYCVIVMVLLTYKTLNFSPNTVNAVQQTAQKG